MEAGAEGLVIRPAEESDAPRLAEIERSSPTPSRPGSSFKIDHGLESFTPERTESVTMVAEVDGSVVGHHRATIHDGVVGGKLRKLAWLHYPQVLVSHRGRAIGRMLRDELRAVCREQVDGCYRLVSVGSDADDGWRSWRTLPVWMLLDSHRVGGPPHGRRATIDDAELIVEMLNAAHRHDELYLPHTPESLAQRLDRAPHEYSWDDLLISDGAVVGMCDGAWKVERHDDGRAYFGLQDNIVDYGFLPGAEGELLRLLRACCGRAAADPDARHVVLWASTGSGGYASMAALTGREFRFQLQASLPDPSPAGAHGVYLDVLAS